MGAKCTIDIYHWGAISALQIAVVPYTPPSVNNLEHYYFPDSALPGGGDTWGVSMIGAVAALREGVADAPEELAAMVPGGVVLSRMMVPVWVRLPPGSILWSSLNSLGAYWWVSGSLWGDVGSEQKPETSVELAGVLIPDLERVYSWEAMSIAPKQSEYSCHSLSE